MGHWVTLEESNQHVYINDKGEVLPRGPGTKPTHKYKGARSEAERSKTAALVAKTRAKRAAARNYVQPSKVDTPSQGALNAAKAHKEAAWSRLKDIRQRIADAGPHAGNLRLEVIKAQDAHNQAKIAHDQAKRAIEKRANELGQTTIKPASKPLHEHAQAAANAVPASKRFGDKAFLVDVHHEYQKTGGKLGLAEFKQKLADSPEARVKLGLSRNDLNAREDHAKTQASEAQVKSGGRVLAEYHFATTTAKPRKK